MQKLAKRPNMTELCYAVTCGSKNDYLTHLFIYKHDVYVQSFIIILYLFEFDNLLYYPLHNLKHLT